MRAAIYTRVSTSGQSTQRQGRALRVYAESKGWTVVREVEETAGGANHKRPLREEVLQLARARAIDAILVQSLDRWGRSVQDLVLTMAELGNRQNRPFLRGLRFLSWEAPQEDDHGSISSRGAFREGGVLVCTCCSLAA